MACRRVFRVAVLAAPLALLPICIATNAEAQPQSAAAESLFNDAKRLMGEGKFNEACPKLEESQRLDPGLGTKFQLANCYQHVGKTASAWGLFREVAGEAKAAGQGARERAARDRAQALEPLLSKVVVIGRTLDGVQGAEVKRDGTSVGRAQWGSAVPVDPGDHVISVTAPGKKPWEKTVNVSATGGRTVTVEIPQLEDDASHSTVVVAPTRTQPAPTTPTTPTTIVTQPTEAPPPPAVVTTPTTTTSTTVVPDTSNGSGQRVFGAVLAGIGVVGLGVGTVMGLESKQKHDDAAAHCNGNLCSPTGVGLRDDAMRDGNISTVAFGVGAAALLGGAIVWFTAPSSTTTTTTTGRLQAAPMIGRGASGFTLRGSF